MNLYEIASFSRLTKQLIIVSIDSVVLIATLLMSFSIRLGYWYFPHNDLVWIIFGAPIVAIPIFVRFGMYKAVIRYIGFRAMWVVAQAVSIYALLWGVIGFMAESATVDVPRSVIVINWLLSLLILVGIRVTARFLFIRSNENSTRRNVLIYGAGAAGRQLSKALEQSIEYNPIAFIDDSKHLTGKQINSLDIYKFESLTKLIDQHKITEVLIAMPSVSRHRRGEIIDILGAYPVLVRALPGVSELAQGRVKIEDLRAVNINDILGRDSVKPNKTLLEANIKNKSVMVTGAGGSIGSELCRQIVNLGASKLILFEQNEHALYVIDKELDGSSSTHIFPILGSVVNQGRVERVYKQFGVQTVYHAAAYKHVPMVEYNSSEGVNNNVIGTLNAANAAINCQVEIFILISTDKAVRPTNTMGATKRVAEMVLQTLSLKQKETKFSMVRFGNVLGSSGSVIPLFQSQIQNGGPVTVTDLDIVRYFMTIPEAVELVIQAGAISKGNDVFVLDMGKPVKIYDLAKKMIHFSGLEVKDEKNPNGDIEIQITKLRPGEKLFEELLIGDNVTNTSHPMIFCANEDTIGWEELITIVKALEVSINNGNNIKLRELLMQAVPGFKPHSDINDLL